MKKYAFIILILCVQFTSSTVKAQFSYKEGRPFEISINEGAFTVDELSPLEEMPLATFMSWPYHITGAAFVSLHKFVSKRVAFGVTAGLDNFTGDLSYGPPNSSNIGGYYNQIGGTTGVYKLKKYTIAAEFKFAYIKLRIFTFYGKLGAGYTFGEDEYTFFTNIQYADKFYGPNGFIPSNPYTVKVSHFNAQVSPLCFRVGNRIAFFGEIGYGYKGFGSIGLAVAM